MCFKILDLQILQYIESKNGKNNRPEVLQYSQENTCV